MPMPMAATAASFTGNSMLLDAIYDLRVLTTGGLEPTKLISSGHLALRQALATIVVLRERAHPRR